MRHAGSVDFRVIPVSSNFDGCNNLMMKYTCRQAASIIVICKCLSLHPVLVMYISVDVTAGTRQGWYLFCPAVIVRGSDNEETPL